MPQKPHEYNQEAYRKLPNEPGKSANAGQVPLTATQKTRKANLMRQFCKRAGRLPGNSQAYKDTWEQVFGVCSRAQEKFKRFYETQWQALMATDQTDQYKRNYELIDWSR